MRLKRIVTLVRSRYDPNPIYARIFCKRDKKILFGGAGWDAP
jgi:hypothetical protein